jgi:hypothetical protein
MLLQIRVKRALAAQPGEGTFCFLTQFYMGHFSNSLLGPAFDSDFDQVGSRPDAGIHATGGNKFSLGCWICRKDFENGDKILIGELMPLCTQQAADEAFGEAAPPGKIALVDAAAFCLALKGNAEITHLNEE